jgi:hypothetical protein
MHGLFDHLVGSLLENPDLMQSGYRLAQSSA